MPLIIDTYNVLHVVGVLPPEIAGIDTAGLIGLVGRSRYRGERVMLVCDGVPPPGGPPGRTGSISVHYAGPASSADDRIAAIIRQSSAPRRLTIVSSDRAVLREGRRRRCSILESADFLRQLANDHHAGVPGPPEGPAAAARPAAPLPSVLPAELIAEAEMLAEREPEPPPPPPAGAPPAGAAPGATGEGEAPGSTRPAAEPPPLDLADLDLADLSEDADRDATIPRDILDEAEALWRSGAGEREDKDDDDDA